MQRMLTFIAMLFFCLGMPLPLLAHQVDGEWHTQWFEDLNAAEDHSLKNKHKHKVLYGRVEDNISPGGVARWNPYAIQIDEDTYVDFIYERTLLKDKHPELYKDHHKGKTYLITHRHSPDELFHTHDLGGESHDIPAQKPQKTLYHEHGGATLDHTHPGGDGVQMWEMSSSIKIIDGKSWHTHTRSETQEEPDPPSDVIPDMPITPDDDVKTPPDPVTPVIPDMPITPDDDVKTPPDPVTPVIPDMPITPDDIEDTKGNEVVETISDGGSPNVEVKSEVSQPQSEPESEPKPVLVPAPLPQIEVLTPEPIVVVPKSDIVLTQVMFLGVARPYFPQWFELHNRGGDANLKGYQLRFFPRGGGEIIIVLKDYPLASGETMIVTGKRVGHFKGHLWGSSEGVEKVYIDEAIPNLKNRWVLTDPDGKEIYRRDVRWNWGWGSYKDRYRRAYDVILSEPYTGDDPIYYGHPRDAGNPPGYHVDIAPKAPRRVQPKLVTLWGAIKKR